MVYRYTWLAVASAILLALARLSVLIRTAEEGGPWQLVVLAAVVLGAVITWTALAYRAQGALVLVINLIALAASIVRIAAPDTARFIFPTTETITSVRADLAYAMDLIQASSAPIVPAAGIIVILTVAFWAIGGLAVWGLTRGRPFVALLPPLALYLQLATIDRAPLEPGWLLAALAVAALSLAAITHDERPFGIGRLGGSGGSVLLPSWSVATVMFVVLLAVVGTAIVGSAVPAAGTYRWRRTSGLTGDFFGSISYNPFISIRKSLLSQSETPVFAAEVTGEVDPANLYWRLLTMDSFNGIWWYAAKPELRFPAEISNFESPGQAFVGPTRAAVQDITILALKSEWLPAAYAPESLESPNDEVTRSFRVATDGSLRFGALTFRGMRYKVLSAVPVPDLAALAVDEQGNPTPSFARAIEDGAFDATAITPAAASDVREEPPNAERYLALPDDFDPAIGLLASSLTRGLQSNYEKALALETWLRDPANGFRYDTSVSTGSSSNDLTSWLLDPENPDYRSGYCEQFASALGALGRAAGIPTRVVLGFTPGDVQPDGTVLVRDRNAHAWVEFWMASQGWVRFDSTPRRDYTAPTAASLPFDITPYLEQPANQTDFATSPGLRPREGQGEEINVPASGTGAGSSGITIPAWLSWLPIVLVAAAAAASLPVLKAIRRRRRLARLMDGDISAAWREITQQLADLGAGPPTASTVTEVALATHREMAPLAHIYEESIYGPGGPTAPGRITVALRSFNATERALEERYPPLHRWLAKYRLRSLLPRRRR